MAANGRPRTSSTAGRNIAIASSRASAADASSRARITSASASTRGCSDSSSVSVRRNHSSSGGGSTWRAIARRASDTTLANVAWRTSCSHSAVRAAPRLACSRCVTSQATSSSDLARSNDVAPPSRSTTPTGPTRVTSRSHSGIVTSRPVPTIRWPLPSTVGWPLPVPTACPFALPLAVAGGTCCAGVVDDDRRELLDRADRGEEVVADDRGEGFVDGRRRGGLDRLDHLASARSARRARRPARRSPRPV